MSAALLGLLVMAIANILTEASGPFEEAILFLRAWIPGSAGMGAYPAKETIGLVVWLLSWAGLHYALRGRDLPLKSWVYAFLVGIGIATLLFWPPVWQMIIGG
jgi:hypothetical protein